MEIIKLLFVHYLPIELESGILYVSRKYEIAGHLCPCGCKNKIITPLGLNEWSLKVCNGKPTLYPSIGNWQLPCRSHYWIRKGIIVWSNQWSNDDISSSYSEEEKQRNMFYENRKIINKDESKVMRTLKYNFKRIMNLIKK